MNKWGTFFLHLLVNTVWLLVWAILAVVTVAYSSSNLGVRVSTSVFAMVAAIIILLCLWPKKRIKPVYSLKNDVWYATLIFLSALFFAIPSELAPIMIIFALLLSFYLGRIYLKNLQPSSKAGYLFISFATFLQYCIVFYSTMYIPFLK